MLSLPQIQLCSQGLVLVAGVQGPEMSNQRVAGCGDRDIPLVPAPHLGDHGNTGPSRDGTTDCSILSFFLFPNKRCLRGGCSHALECIATRIQIAPSFLSLLLV